MMDNGYDDGHCLYHTFPLDHCGEATHRGWPFLTRTVFPSRAFCLCTGRFELTAGQCRLIGHLGNFQKATENSPFSLRHVKRSCH